MAEVPLLPAALTGTSPAQERLQQDVKGKKGLSRLAAAIGSVPGQLGDVAGSFGQMLNPANELLDVAATATGRVPGTDVELSGTDRLLGAGLFALGASAGYSGYRRRQQGQPLVERSEAGAVRLPGAKFSKELGLEAQADGWRRGVVEGRPALLEAGNTDAVIDAVNRFGEPRKGRPAAADVELGKAQMRAFITTVGEDLTQRPGGLHADTPQRFIDPDEANGVAARWELAKFDHLTGMTTSGRKANPILTGGDDIVDAWADLRHGYPVRPEALERLRTFVGSFAEATRDFTPDMLPPPSWRLAEVAVLPSGEAEVRLAPTRAVLPKQSLLAQPKVGSVKHKDLEQRLGALDYRALVPYMAKNIVDFHDLFSTGTEKAVGRIWYGQANRHVKRAARLSGQPEGTVAGVVAAFSPRTKWLPDNVAAMYRHLGHGEAFRPDAQPMVLPKNAEKAERITTGDKTWEEVLEQLRGGVVAGKTPAFATNILHPELPAPTTMDSHHFDVAMGGTMGVDAPIFENPSAYEAVAAATRIANEVLRTRGGGYDTTNQLQATVWQGIQDIKADLAKRGKRRKVDTIEDQIGETSFFWDDTILRIAEGRDDASIAGVVSRIGPLTTDVLPGDQKLLVAQHGDGSVGLIADLGDRDLHAAVRLAYPTVLAGEKGNAIWRRGRFGLRDEVGDGFVETLRGGRPAGATAGFDLRSDLENLPLGLDDRSAWAFHLSDPTAAGELAERLKGAGWAQARVLPPHTGERPRRNDRFGAEDLAAMPPAVLQGPESPLHTNSWVAISASAPGSKPADHARLRRALAKAGFKPIEARGAWVNDAGQVETEDSFVVFGMTPDQAVRYGQDFRQVSVMTPHGEMFTTAGDERTPLADPSKVQLRPASGRWVLSDKGDETIKAEGGGTIIPLPDGRNLTFSAGMDWGMERPDIPEVELASVRPAPAAQHTVVVQFEDQIPDGVDVNSVLTEARRWSAERATTLEPVGYFYGDPGVPGYDKAWEWNFADEAGRRMAYRTAVDGAMAPNATTVWLPAHGRPTETANTGLTGGTVAAINDTEFAYGGVRILHGAEKIGTNTKGPMHFSYDGRRPRAFGIALDPGRAPRVAIGSNADDVAGRMPGPTVLVERKGDGLLVTAPDGKLDTAVDGLEVLHRLGLPATPTKVMVVDADGAEVARFGAAA